jgi:hypothetical protein
MSCRVWNIILGLVDFFRGTCLLGLSNPIPIGRGREGSRSLSGRSRLGSR